MKKPQNAPQPRRECQKTGQTHPLQGELFDLAAFSPPPNRLVAGPRSKKPAPPNGVVSAQTFDLAGASGPEKVDPAAIGPNPRTASQCLLSFGSVVAEPGPVAVPNPPDPEPRGLIRPNRGARRRQRSGPHTNLRILRPSSGRRAQGLAKAAGISLSTYFRTLAGSTFSPRQLDAIIANGGISGPQIQEARISYIEHACGFVASPPPISEKDQPGHVAIPALHDTLMGYLETVGRATARGLAALCHNLRIPIGKSEAATILNGSHAPRPDKMGAILRAIANSDKALAAAELLVAFGVYHFPTLRDALGRNVDLDRNDCPKLFTWRQICRAQPKAKADGATRKSG